MFLDREHGFTPNASFIWGKQKVKLGFEGWEPSVCRTYDFKFGTVKRPTFDLMHGHGGIFDFSQPVLIRRMFGYDRLE